MLSHCTLYKGDIVVFVVFDIKLIIGGRKLISVIFLYNIYQNGYLSVYIQQYLLLIEVLHRLGLINVDQTRFTSFFEWNS